MRPSGDSTKLKRALSVIMAIGDFMVGYVSSDAGNPEHIKTCGTLFKGLSAIAMMNTVNPSPPKKTISTVLYITSTDTLEQKRSP